MPYVLSCLIFLYVLFSFSFPFSLSSLSSFSSPSLYFPFLLSTLLYPLSFRYPLSFLSFNFSSFSFSSLLPLFSSSFSYPCFHCHSLPFGFLLSSQSSFFPHSHPSRGSMHLLKIYLIHYEQ